MTPWREKEKANWLIEQAIQRSYLDNLVSKIYALRNRFDVRQYGALSYDPEKYPLFLLKNLKLDTSKKNLLITGGVHAYQTSVVQGELKFLKNEANNYVDQFNIIVAPIVHFLKVVLRKSVIY